MISPHRLTTGFLCLLALLLPGAARADPYIQALQRELQALDAEKTPAAPLAFGALPFAPGGRDPQVAVLRARLGAAYDPPAGPPDYYDDALGAAVMDFQRRHNLPGDGTIDAATLAALNRPAAARRAQVAANLARDMALPQPAPDAYVLVNIPQQQLWAVRGGRTVLSMKVAVGSPDRPTPAFAADITGIRFNPAWTVPPGIKIRDLLPQLQANPHALDGTGVEFIEGQGHGMRTIDPAGVDWRHVTRTELARIRMVQAPGANNALGRIRVLMPNSYGVYLHDTDAPEIFAQENRAESSGCIRLSQPEAMARFVLADNPDWSEDKMQEKLAAGGTAEIPAAKKIPVYIVYQTMWLDAAGRLIYGPDPYGLDKKQPAANQHAAVAGISSTSALALVP